MYSVSDLLLEKSVIDATVFFFNMTVKSTQEKCLCPWHKIMKYWPCVYINIGTKIAFIEKND